MFFDKETVNELFPFYLLIDSSLKIIDAGKTLKEKNKTLVGEQFDVVVKLHACSLINYKCLKERVHKRVIITINSKKTFTLTGTIIYNVLDESLLFVGFPWFYSFNEMNQMPLQNTQLGLVDNSFDYLMMLQTNELSLGDTVTTLQKYKKQKTDLEKLSLVAKESTNAILITDKNLRIEWANKAFQDLYGYETKELIGKLPYEVLGGADTHSKLIIEAVNNKKLLDIETIGYKKDGTKLWTHIKLQPIFNANGEITNFFSIEEDITQRIEAQNKIKTQTQEIVESEEKYRLLFENIGSGFQFSEVFFDDNNEPIDFNFIEGNKNMKKYIGYDIEEIRGKTIREILPNADMNMIKVYGNLALNGGTYENEYFSNTFKKYFSVKCYSPKKGFFVAIFDDITERKTTEENIRRKEAETRTMIQTVPDLILRFHKDGTILECLSTNEEIMIAPKEVIEGKNIREFVPPSSEREAIEKFKLAIDTKEVVEYEYSLLINNEIKHFENRTKSINDEEVLSIIRDITDKKNLESELLTSNNRLTKLIGNLQSGILVEDANRKIALVNKEFCDLFSIPVDDPNMLIGYDCKEASEQSKSLFAEPEKFIDDVETILQNKVKVQKELLKLKDGRVFSRDYLPIFYQNNYLGHLWSYADITEEIKDKEYLISVIEKEKNLNQLKSKFMRITSHEIRTPLTAVFANIELLELIIKKGGISQNILHEYFSKMKKEINRMDSILSELILVGKMEEGKSFFKFQHRNIISYLINIVNEFYTPYSDGRSATVINNSKINEIVFCEKMLKHAIINILNNAFKYSAGKTSPIMVIDADEQFITITVQDFGIGIPDNEIDMVFESFYRAQNVSNISGSGIGLMFSDFIVKQHQGTIKIESRLNEGSIVKITLPINLELNKTIQ